MSMKDGKGEKKEGLTRREFIKKTGLATAAVGTSTALLPKFVKRAEAAKRDYILIGRPNPSTGGISVFGEATPWADDNALKKINGDGGIYIKEYGKKVPVKIKIVDTESNPTKAAEVGARLIVRDKIDLMIAFHTPLTVNPIAGICERYKMPCITLDAPVDAWLTGGPYHWNYHAFWTVSDILDVYIGMWNEVKTNKVVGILMDNTPDGVSWSALFAKVLPKHGFKVVDLGRFPMGQKDYSTFITAWKKENVEIIAGCLNPPDWATAWKQCQRQGLHPKVATPARASLFPSAVGALGGDLPMGLSTEVWWSIYHPFKSSLTGESSEALCKAWMAETGKEWTQPIGFKHAGYEIAVDALKRAQTLDKEKIRQAIADTNLNTIVGPIKYNKDHYSQTPLVGGQWSKGTKFPWKLNIVFNGAHKNIPVTGKMAAIQR